MKASVSGAQHILGLKQALERGVSSYGSVKAKEYGVLSIEAALQQTRRDYLPNVVFSAQQSYGTINGQNGPMYGFGGYGVASSGLPLPEQNWNAAFGALYLGNINWEVFSFGKAKARIHAANSALNVSEKDLAQEQFQHQVRIAAAYLNVLAARRLEQAQAKNLERALIFKKTVVARAKSGLIAGVDSSLANAGVSSARIAFIKSRDFHQEEMTNLSLLLGMSQTDFSIDTSFVNRLPISNGDRVVETTHPVLSMLQSRVGLSMHQSRLIRKAAYPSFSLFGVLQKRASGFQAGYAQDQTAFSNDYLEGITPTRTNYLIGAGLAWNVSSLSRVNAQRRAQDYTTLSHQSEYDLADQELKAQLALSNTKLRNALETSYEAPIQVASAQDAYTQQSALYNNGLTTIVEVTQTLYALNRAETDRDIAFINVWQALLLKAAASGDLQLFTDEL